jgi:hypothetical protein
MNTDQKTESIQRSDPEQRADRIWSALEHLSSNEKVSDLAWQYFRRGDDKLAFMLLQTQALHDISGYLEEIQMTLDNFTDENGNFSVGTYERSD